MRPIKFLPAGFLVLSSFLSAQVPGILLERGLSASVFTTLARPVGLAFPPAGSLFSPKLHILQAGAFMNGPAGGGLYVADANSGLTTVVQTVGLDPTGLAFDPHGSYGKDLFITNLGAGNGDNDGCVMRVTPAYGVTTFVFPFTGLHDTYGITFGRSAGFGTDMFVCDDVDGAASLFDVFRISQKGVVASFADLGGPTSLIAGDPASWWGGHLFVANSLGGGWRGTGEVLSLDSAGKVVNTLVTGFNGVTGLTFGVGNVWGDDMFGGGYLVGKSVWRMDTSGAMRTVLLGVDNRYHPHTIAFDPVDGADMYVTDLNRDRVLRVTTEAGVSFSGSFKPGSSVDVTLRSPWDDGGRAYIAAASFNHRPGVKIGKRIIPVVLDPLFAMSQTMPVFFEGFQGVLTLSGTGKARIHVPAIPALSGLRIYVTFVTLQAGAPDGISRIAAARSFVIQ